MMTKMMIMTKMMMMMMVMMPDVIDIVGVVVGGALLSSKESAHVANNKTIRTTFFNYIQWMCAQRVSNSNNICTSVNVLLLNRVDIMASILW